MVWQAVAGLGSNIAGAFINSASSSRAAKKAFNYNKQLLDIQQKWQERMSNTAHQREVSDLRKAGLNPILSATGGSGASFGSASAPGMSVEPGKVDSDLGISSALALRQQKNTNKLTESQTKLNDKTIDKLDSDTKVNSANAKKVDQDIKNSIDLTKAQVNEMKERAENLKEERKYIKYNAETNRASANAQGVSAGASARDVSNKIKSDAYGSPIGKAYNSGKRIWKDFKSTSYGKVIHKGIKLYNKYSPSILRLVK